MGQHQVDVRQHLLDTGKAFVLGKGFTAAGLAEVLAAAGVPKGSFYHYFESKEQFGEAMLESYFSAYLQAMEEVLRPDGSPARERFLRYWSRWLNVQQECLVVKLGAEVSDLSEAMRTALHRGTDSVIARLAACVAEGAADGSLPGLDPRGLVLALYDLWLGASLLTKIRRDLSALTAAMATTEALLIP